MLSYAVKWAHENRVIVRGLCDYSGYKSNVEDDSKLVTDLTVQRAASIRILENVRSDEWTRAAIHPQYGEITIEWIVNQWLNHDRNHLKQLTELLKEEG